MGTELTKESYKFLCIVYKEYLERRKNGLTKDSAANFGNPQAWEPLLFKALDSADVGAAVSELGRAALIKCYLGHGFILNDSAIIYMEQRFPHGIEQILNWLGKIKSAIPFA